jgi:hypothetical protein
LESEQLVAQPGSPSKEGKPELKCTFCSRIKSFKSVTALWSHFVHQHYDSGHSEASPYGRVVVEIEHLLEEIRRTAHLWHIYWEEFSDGGKQRNPTMMKLKQVVEEGFSWDIVLGWNLC